MHVTRDLYAREWPMESCIMKVKGTWPLLPWNSTKQLPLEHSPIFNTNVNIHIDRIIIGRTLSPTLTNYGVYHIRVGAGLPGNFWTQPKTHAHPVQHQKKYCPCILKGCLIKNLILSALHLQGLKSNIYVHFHFVNKQLIEISFRKWNHQRRT
jgi:hypothetical protein